MSTLFENKNKFLTEVGFEKIVKSIEKQIATNLCSIEKIVVDEEAFGTAICIENKTGNKYEVIFEVNIKDGAKYLLTRRK